MENTHWHMAELMKKGALWKTVCCMTLCYCVQLWSTLITFHFKISYSNCNSLQTVSVSWSTMLIFLTYVTWYCLNQLGIFYYPVWWNKSLQFGFGFFFWPKKKKKKKPQQIDRHRKTWLQVRYGWNVLTVWRHTKWREKLLTKRQ